MQKIDCPFSAGCLGKMLTRKPFDPLLSLERNLELNVYYSKRGIHIVLHGLAAFPEDKQRQARQVVKLYPRILKLQLDAPKRELRPSVCKLMVQGNVEIVRGRYLVNV